MDILDIIKKRASIRKYQDKPIPKEILDKIIEAGIWGPSVPSFLRIQSWKFVVITKKRFKKQLSEILINKSQKSKAGLNIMLRSAGNIVANSSVTIVVYKSSKELENFKTRCRQIYLNFENLIKTAQLSAISATIQNMILTAEALGVSSCWLDLPLLCKKEVSGFLNSDDELMAFLTLGYAAEEGKRSPRKPISETVKYIK